MSDLNFRKATRNDSERILFFIKELAKYEKLEHEVVATIRAIEETLFGDKQYAEVIIANYNGEDVGFSLFFHNYSTFLGQPGIYLEDLFVLPDYRGKGIGKALLKNLAKIAVERNCGRLDWSVLDWNPAIDFYEKLGAKGQKEWLTYRLSGEALIELAK